MYGVKTKWSVDYDLDCEQSLFFRHKQSNLEVRAAKLQSLNCWPLYCGRGKSAVSKRFLLTVSPLELLNSTDYEKKGLLAV